MTKIRIKRKIDGSYVRYCIQVRFLLFFWKDFDWESTLECALEEATRLEQQLSGKSVLSLDEAVAEVVKTQRERAKK